jgi:two-component system, response regulator YesN
MHYATPACTELRKPGKGDVKMDSILIADDEFLIRKGLRAILERSNLVFSEICECEDGLQALRLMTERKFDLAIMDIRMPAMDGLTAIKEALELESPPCFIILSGFDDFTYARQAIRFGVQIGRAHV